MFGPPNNYIENKAVCIVRATEGTFLMKKYCSMHLDMLYY